MMSAPFDVAVIGGGPAGLAAGIANARLGARVIVLEQRNLPLDKACGEGLMPRAVASLAHLGVTLEGVGRTFRGIDYRHPGAHATGLFPRGQTGRGVRRTKLVDLLVEAASQAGVELLFGTPALGLEPGGVRTPHGQIHARWIVGADGLRSRVRVWAGLEARRAVPFAGRWGLVRHLEHPEPGDKVQVWFGSECEAYWTPLGPREVGLALLLRKRGRGFEGILRERFGAELVDLVSLGKPLDVDRGSGTFGRRARAPTDGKTVFLVGDAHESLDASTGLGLSLAFQEAVYLADSLSHPNPPAEYARWSSALRRTPRQLTFLLVALQEHAPFAVGPLVQALSRHPSAFDSLLGYLGGVLPPKVSLLRGMLRANRKQTASA